MGASTWFKPTTKPPPVSPPTTVGGRRGGGETGGGEERLGKRRAPAPSKQNIAQMPVESVLFFPVTPGGELRRRIQQRYDEFARLHRVPRVRVVERGGTKLVHRLGRSDPWADSHWQGEVSALYYCHGARRDGGRESGGRRGMCNKEGVTYRVTCLVCEGEGIVASYQGESSRSDHQWQCNKPLYHYCKQCNNSLYYYWQCNNPLYHYCNSKQLPLLLLLAVQQHPLLLLLAVQQPFLLLLLQPQQQTARQPTIPPWTCPSLPPSPPTQIPP